MERYEFLWRPEVFLIALPYPEFANTRAFGGVLEEKGAVEGWLLFVVFDGGMCGEHLTTKYGAPDLKASFS